MAHSHSCFKAFIGPRSLLALGIAARHAAPKCAASPTRTALYCTSTSIQHRRQCFGSMLRTRTEVLCELERPARARGGLTGTPLMASTRVALSIRGDTSTKSKTTTSDSSRCSILLVLHCTALYGVLGGDHLCHGPWLACRAA
jgi:hypothetical protein